ncbi:PIG-L family deacetylase [Embleya sp. NPDC055664]
MSADEVIPDSLESSLTAPLASHFVQIVAHEDDDLLFMNPDIQAGLSAGISTSTIYVTAGQGFKTGDDAAVYAAGRQAGVLAAYAQMAGVSGCDGAAAGPAGCWDSTAVTVLGHTVQKFALKQRPDVHLFFLSLPDGHGTEAGSLEGLFAGTETSLQTIRVNGQAAGVVWPQSYTRADLINVLRELLSTLGATSVRIQDTAPDPNLFHDHADHVAAARFGEAAYIAYGATNNRVLLDRYRDYNISNMPVNLSPAEKAAKWATANVYIAHDSELVGTDLTQYEEWSSREYPRSPRGTNWIGRDSAGRLRAFVVQSGDLLEWSQDDALVWSGPVTHGNPGGPLDAGLTVAADQDGRLEVFGQRRDTGEIVTRYQLGGGGWSWGAFGNPNGGANALLVSVPAVIANADGRLQFFVRNAGGGISSRWQTQVNGAWSGWADMGGSGIQGPPTAIVTADGRIELFAPTVDHVLHWYQSTPNGAMTTDTTFPVVVPASRPMPARDQDGRIELYYRRQGTAEIAVRYQTTPGGNWPGSTVVGSGQSGIGEPAAVTDGTGRIVLMARNRGGGVSYARQSTPNNVFGAWVDRGGFQVGTPGAAVDRDGRVELLIVDPRGQVLHSRQDANGVFPAWTLIG